jgi:hypothetical protein
MRKTLFALIAAFILFACKKEDGIDRDQFIGVWEYENFHGYPFGNYYQPPGNGQIIVIDELGKYKEMQQTTVTHEGSYSLEKKKDCHGDEKKIFFSTGETPSGLKGSVIRIDEQGRLTFSTSSCYMDGGVTVYRRIQ